MVWLEGNEGFLKNGAAEAFVVLFLHGAQLVLRSIVLIVLDLVCHLEGC